MATSPQSETHPQLTFWSQELLANLSPLPVSEEDWMTIVATWQSSFFDLLKEYGPVGLFGRTSLASCRQTSDGILEPLSESWGSAGMGSPGEFWTLNFSEWPNDATVCSLSDVLEVGSVPQRYFLTARACGGNPEPCRQTRQTSSYDTSPSLTGSDRGVRNTGESRGQDCVVADYVPEIVPQAMSSKWSKGSSGPAGDEVANLIAVSISENQRSEITMSDNVIPPLSSGGGKPGQSYPVVALPLHDKVTRHAGHSQDRDNADGNGNGLGVGAEGDPMFTLTEGDHHAVAIAMRQREGCPGGGKGPLLSNEQSLTLAANTNDQVLFHSAGRRMAVRRLTPRECERLQGFPDDFTLIIYKGKPAKDGPRYKVIGNSMAVPVMRWIGKRIDTVNRLRGWSN